MSSLQGKVVLVSGAVGGLGEAFARAVVDAGGSVMLTDIDEQRLTRLAAELGDQADAHRLDVRDEALWHAAVEATIARFGTITGLVNNAGVGTSRCLLEHETAAQFMGIVEVNLLGVHLGMRAVIPHLRASGGGSIVNISSAAGLTGIPQTGAYAAAKWGVRGLTKVAAVELGGDRIRVNSVHPGMIDTDMTAFLGVSTEIGSLPSTPAGRAGTPAEVAGVVAFLLSDAATYMNGAEIAVDGGRTAGPATG